MQNSSWNVEMTIDFYAEETSTSLPAGTYTVTDTKAVGTVNSAASDITLRTGHPIDGGYFKSGTVTVAENEGQYTITLDIVDKTDQKIGGTFTMPISNMDLSK